MMVTTGDGALALFKYCYPTQRAQPDPQDQRPRGVAGTLQQLARQAVTQQPVTAFDWSPDKDGLFACTSLDQCIRIGFIPPSGIRGA